MSERATALARGGAFAAAGAGHLAYELMPIAVLIGTIYAGAAGAVVRVHHPAHRRPGPGARAGCWRSWGWVRW